jgi:hypothetical protein
MLRKLKLALSVIALITLVTTTIETTLVVPAFAGGNCTGNCRR